MYMSTTGCRYGVSHLDDWYLSDCLCSVAPYSSLCGTSGHVRPPALCPVSSSTRPPLPLQTMAPQDFGQWRTCNGIVSHT